MVWIETPTNPALSIVDIAAVAEARARARRARRRRQHVRDAVPPAAARARRRRVVHSSTKYLGGHSDVVGGFVAVHDAELADELRFLQNAMGAVPSPFDCYLVLRGVKTLAVRMDRHCENARAIVAAARASTTPSRACSIPGCRPSRSRGRAPADARLRRHGVVPRAGGEDAALDVVARTRLFTLAESLGAVESLIEHPARMTHASAAGSPLEVDPALVRLLGRHRDDRRSRRRPPAGARRAGLVTSAPAIA